MRVTKFLQCLAKAEGGKEQVNIAQLGEQFRKLDVMLLGVPRAMVKSGSYDIEIEVAATKFAKEKKK
jgi:ribosomal protein L18E